MAKFYFRCLCIYSTYLGEFTESLKVTNSQIQNPTLSVSLDPYGQLAVVQDCLQNYFWSEV